MSIENLASPQFTANVKFTDAFWCAASSTWKVSEKLPVCVGVPQSQPAQPVVPFLLYVPLIWQLLKSSPFAKCIPVGSGLEAVPHKATVHRCHCTNGPAPFDQVNC